MKPLLATYLALQVAANDGGKRKSKNRQIKPVTGRTDKMINCRFWDPTRTESHGEINPKAGEVLPSQCWPIQTDCEHGIEVSFAARNFRDICIQPSNPEFQVYMHYEDKDWADYVDDDEVNVEEAKQKSFNFCSESLPPDSNTYGDWIYLNGSQNALIEYQADSFDYQANFKVKWQCFGMASSVWRRYIGNGWESIIQTQQDMQERFKIKLHRIVTKLMLQITMKDKCLSEPSLAVLKRIENSKDIDQWVQNIIRLIRQRFSTCKPALAKEDDTKTIRHMEFKKTQAENLKQKANTLIQKFEKFSAAPSQDLIDTRIARRSMSTMERRALKKALGLVKASAASEV